MDKYNIRFTIGNDMQIISEAVEIREGWFLFFYRSQVIFRVNCTHLVFVELLDRNENEK